MQLSFAFCFYPFQSILLSSSSSVCLSRRYDDNDIYRARCRVADPIRFSKVSDRVLITFRRFTFRIPRSSARARRDPSARLVLIVARERRGSACCNLLGALSVEAKTTATSIIIIVHLRLIPLPAIFFKRTFPWSRLCLRCTRYFIDERDSSAL